jgi:DNA-binding MarR family transcriptional regulator
MTKVGTSHKIKHIFDHPFTFLILSKIFNGYRPVQIAEQLHVTPQDINYHTERMISFGLISKYIDENENRSGILWRLTEKGIFILKQKLTWSVNPFSNSPRGISVRLENVSIAFKINGQIPDSERFRWTKIKNGVSKCTISKTGHTIEIIKSEKQERGEEGGGSNMLIHLSKQYCFDWTSKLIKESYLALEYARRASIQFGIKIHDYGCLVKRPHFAFEYDMIASFLAISQTAEIKIEGERGKGAKEDLKAWIDSSTGTGELETNDPEYAYRYLNMPNYIMDIHEAVASLHSLALGYYTCWHPGWTYNN